MLWSKDTELWSLGGMHKRTGLTFDSGRCEWNGQWYVVPALKQRVSYRNAERPCTVGSAITTPCPLFGKPADPHCALAQCGGGSRSPGYKHAVPGAGDSAVVLHSPPPDLLFNETHVPCAYMSSTTESRVEIALFASRALNVCCGIRHAFPPGVRSSYDLTYQSSSHG